MNPDLLIQSLHQGFRITLGAASSLIETLQDPHKRDQNLSKLQAELNDLTTIWAEKGTTTEQEARAFIETLLSQRQSSDRPSSEAPNSYRPSNHPVPSPTVQAELQELITQISALREEIEKLEKE